MAEHVGSSVDGAGAACTACRTASAQCVLPIGQAQPAYTCVCTTVMMVSLAQGCYDCCCIASGPSGLVLGLVLAGLVVTLHGEARVPARPKGKRACKAATSTSSSFNWPCSSSLPCTRAVPGSSSARPTSRRHDANTVQIRRMPKRPWHVPLHHVHPQHFPVGLAHTAADGLGTQPLVSLQPVGGGGGAGRAGGGTRGRVEEPSLQQQPSTGPCNRVPKHTSMHACTHAASANRQVLLKARGRAGWARPRATAAGHGSSCIHARPRWHTGCCCTRGGRV